MGPLHRYFHSNTNVDYFRSEIRSFGRSLLQTDDDNNNIDNNDDIRFLLSSTKESSVFRNEIDSGTNGETVQP